MAKRPAIAVIGAGIAGLAATCRLVKSGARVTLFERGAGVGGRMATRRAGGYIFDCGTQFFTLRDPGFAALVRQAEQAEAAAPWTRRWGRWQAGRLQPEALADPRYVGVSGMSSFCRHVAEGQDLMTERSVQELARHPDGWEPLTQRGPLGERFDAVAVAVPAPQARALVEGLCDFGERVTQAGYAPCWAVMAGFAEALAIDCDGITFDDPVLAWAGRDSSKPGRPATAEAWVLHATPAWSREQRGLASEEAARQLLGRFLELLAVQQEPKLLFAHFWPLARVEQPLGEACLWDPGSAVGACGDWCLGARVEDAWCSGDALGAAMAKSLCR